MIPVVQSRIGKRGTCFRAALASILELAEQQVPDFGGDDPPQDEYWARVDAWLAGRGLCYRQVPIEPGGESPIGWHTIEGLSPRGGNHAVVGFDGEFAHDPHPSWDDERRGLVEPRVWGLLLPVRSGARVPAEDVVDKVTCAVCGRMVPTYVLQDATRKGVVVAAMHKTNLDRGFAVSQRITYKGRPLHSVKCPGSYQLPKEAAEDCLPIEFCPQCGFDAEHCRCPNKAGLLSGHTVRTDPRANMGDASRYVEKAQEIKTALRALGYEVSEPRAATTTNSVYMTVWRTHPVTAYFPRGVEWLAEVRVSDHVTGHYLSFPAGASTPNAVARIKKHIERQLKANEGKDADEELHAVRVGGPEPAGGKTYPLPSKPPFKPGDTIRLKNGRKSTVTKVAAARDLFGEPEWHISTASGDVVVVKQGVPRGQ